MTMLGDRYRLVAPIATGGMGSVWEGWDERLHRPVAIKRLHVQPGLDPQSARVAAERMLREARNAARLHHPHAVPVYDVIEEDGRPSIVMQYLPAPSLQQVLATRGPLDVATAARLGSEIASALEAAHRVGIVHRDVKPANVLLDDGGAKLTDFGISHAYGDSSLTSTGLVTGTPAFLAPEVAQGAPAGPASDVFSLGATLYAAVEGTPPFGDGQNAMATLHRAASGRVDPPQRAGALTPLLQQMLAIDPAHRPPMAALPELLRSVGRPGSSPPTVPLTAPPTVVLPPIAPAPSAAPAPRRTAPLIVALLVAAALVGGLIALLNSRSGGGDSGNATGGGVPSAGGTHPASQSAGSSAPAHTSSPAPPTTRSAPAQPAPPAQKSADPAAAVRHYYSLLPRNTDGAWQLLTAKFQNGRAGGRDAFDRYWASVRSVSASDAVATGKDKATATISYVYRGGRHVSERTEFTFKRQGGVLKIDKTSAPRGSD
jgi:serine/threonine protein kinase